MVSMTIDMPEGALAAMRQDSVGFAHEMRLAAAVKWYELRRVSQGGDDPHHSGFRINSAVRRP